MGEGCVFGELYWQGAGLIVSSARTTSNMRKNLTSSSAAAEDHDNSQQTMPASVRCHLEPKEQHTKECQDSTVEHTTLPHLDAIHHNT